ncbi:MAG: hypothetical protein EBQ92_01495 [Proteobacteria bacterium]|nr:hypothetical protein [Pseudomonadota bacterium]
MNKIIVIGDIHNHWVEAEEIASLYDKTHRVIFTGDYFDDFGDTAEDARQTAKWLKESLDKPNRIHLMGNHDINYSYLNFVKDANGNLQNIYNCSGYDTKKDYVINEVMTESDWDKIKFAHFENGWWFSHAGFHPHWFEHPVKGMSNDAILDKLAKATDDYLNRTWNETIGAVGRCRGGMQKVGGILWLDSQREATLVSNFKQVYGHTPTMGRIDIWDDQVFKNAANINIDCGLCQVFEIDEYGDHGTIDTELPNFYLTSQEKRRKKFMESLSSYDEIYKNL